MHKHKTAAWGAPPGAPHAAFTYSRGKESTT
jgi:hypothetical protein